MSRTLLTALFCFAVLAASPHSYSQAKEPEDEFSAASQAAGEARMRAIKAELRRGWHPDWAGEYYFGDHLGVNVRLALSVHHGYAYTWRGCLGLYDMDYGDFEFTDGTVKLKFRYKSKYRGTEGLGAELRPVRWGNRHYLIPVNHMVEFANAINSGMEPSMGGTSGSFLLKRGDENRPVLGQPNIPAEYLSYLLKKPIKASILSVGKTETKECCRFTTVTVDAGNSVGLRKGMRLYVRSPRDIWAEVRVTEVNDSSSVALIEQNDPKEGKPSTSWKLSTRLIEEQDEAAK